jgi:hypothetical protein
MLTNSKKPWRVSSNHWAGIAMLAALAAAPAYVAQTGFAQKLIARASSDLQARELIGWRRPTSVSGSVPGVAPSKRIGESAGLILR